VVVGGRLDARVAVCTRRVSVNLRPHPLNVEARGNRFLDGAPKYDANPRTSKTPSGNALHKTPRLSGPPTVGSP
jgi:hypothetical protein